MKTAMETTVLNQRSWVFEMSPVRFAISRQGGMVAPVEFFLDRDNPFSPYFVNPWHDEGLQLAEPVLGPLRGNFFCLPFGTSDAEHPDQNVHGDTVATEWELVEHVRDEQHVRVSLACATGNPAGRVTKEIILRRGHNAVYSRHRLEGYGATVPLGFHATLSPTHPDETLALTIGPHDTGIVSERMKRFNQGEYNCLRAGSVFENLGLVPTIWEVPDYLDCTTFPHQDGFTDIVLVTRTKPAVSGPVCNAVVFPKAKALWFSAKDPSLLPSTMIWMESGGRHQPPWNGRTRCVGIEDVCAYGGMGITLSTGSNPFSRIGVKTAMELKPDVPLDIPYIEGAVAIPDGFDRVEAYEFGDQCIRFRSPGGLQVQAEVAWEDLFRNDLSNPDGDTCLGSPERTPSRR